MAKLYAPAGLRSLGIEDGDYTVAEDGTVEVAGPHVEAALAHGCSHERPAPAEAAAPEDGLARRLDEAEARIAALEQALAGKRSGRAAG
jgi:hypothetical protein